MGLAFRPLSAVAQTPATAMDSWVGRAGLPNKVAFHGCPYLLASQSFIDFGNQTANPEVCPGLEASVKMPTKSYYTLNVYALYIAGVAQPLPAGVFQPDTTSFYGGIQWSILDSCTSNILVTQAILTNLQTKIKASGAFSSTLQASPYLTQWLNGEVTLQLNVNSINYAALPNITFQMVSGMAGYTTTSLTIGPHQYIQANAAGYYTFMVSVGTNQQIVLGLPFFSAFHIVIDRDLGIMTFDRGCGCSTATDGYPTISVGNEAVVWRASTSSSAKRRPDYLWVVLLMSVFLLI